MQYSVGYPSSVQPDGFVLISIDRDPDKKVIVVVVKCILWHTTYGVYLFIRKEFYKSEQKGNRGCEIYSMTHHLQGVFIYQKGILLIWTKKLVLWIPCIYMGLQLKKA